MRYKGSNKPLPEIARELGVEGIIAGSVFRSGDRVRTTAQLIYAPQDKNIWAQSYERDLKDVLALQSTVASAIAEEIRVKMTPGEQAQLNSRRPVNLKAHEAYLPGRYHLQLEENAAFKKDKARVMDAESEKAKAYFQQSIKEDADYAPPFPNGRRWQLSWNTGNYRHILATPTTPADISARSRSLPKNWRPPRPRVSFPVGLSHLCTALWETRIEHSHGWRKLMKSEMELTV